MLGRRQDHRGDDRLLDHLDEAGVGQLRRAVDLLHDVVGRRHPVEHARRRRHQVHVVLALEALLHDLHVQQAEEAAAEAEPERRRRLRLVEERRVVQAQLLERVAQLGVLVALDRVEAGEHHRLQRLEAGERLERRAAGLGDRVADLRVADLLDVGDEKADFADAELVDRNRLRREDADLQRLVVLPFGHQADLHARPQHAVDHADDDHHAAVGVVPGVENQRLQRRVGIARRRRQAMDDRLEDLVDAGADLRAGEDRVVAVEADDLGDLAARLLGLRAGQIDLVDDRDDLEVVLDREVGVGQRLRLDALRRVDDQQRPFAGGQRPRDLVGEVDVPRRVDQVQDVLLAVLRRVVQADRVRLDGDAALALEIHRVEDLRLHLARLEGAGDLEKAVGERRLAVVDVRDDRKVSDVAWFHAVYRPNSLLSPFWRHAAIAPTKSSTTEIPCLNLSS